MPRGYKKLVQLLTMGAGYVLPKHVPELALALGDPDVEIRRKAATLLRQAGPSVVKALPQLVRLMQDRDAMARMAAVWCLGQAGRTAREALPALIERLKDEDAEVRRAAITTIEKIGLEPTDRLEALLPAVQDEKLEIQRVAVRLLNKLGQHTPQAAPLLQHALRDNDWEIFEQSALALGRMGRAALPAVPVMLSVLAANVWPSDRARSVVSQALATIGPSAVEGLAAALTDPDPDTRLAALGFLQERGADARAVFPTLFRALDDSDPAVRTEAITTLLELSLEPERAIPLFLPLLRDKEAEVRDAAAMALGGMRSQAAAAVPHLIDQLDQQFAEGAFAAAYALGHIGAAAAPAVPKLLRLLRSGSREKRQAVIFALGRIGARPGEVIPALARELTSDDQWLRDYAAEAIAQFGAAALPHLREALHHEEAPVRQRALEALRRLSPEVAAQAQELLRSMQSENWADVRRAAGEAMHSAGFDDVAEALLRLESEDKRERIQAIQALMKLGPRAREAGPALFDALIDSLADDRFGVRTAADRALGDIGGWEAADVRGALGHPDKYVRRWAAGALRRLDPEAAHSLDAWIAALTDDDWDVRQAARLAVEGAKDTAAPRLLPLLRHPDRNLRRWAARLLREAGHAAEVAVAEASRGMSGGGGVLVASESSAGGFGSGAMAGVGAVGVGAMAASSADLNRAVASFRQGGEYDRASVAAVEGVMGHAPSTAESHAPDRLRGIAGSPRLTPAVQALVRSLADYNEQTARASMKALAQVGAAAVPALLPVLEHGSADERRRAAKVLARIGPAARAAAPWLRELTQDDHPMPVRLAARAALRRVG